MTTQEMAVDIARGIASKQFEYPTLKTIWDRQGGVSFKHFGRRIEASMNPYEIRDLYNWFKKVKVWKNNRWEEVGTKEAFKILIKSKL